MSLKNESSRILVFITFITTILFSIIMNVAFNYCEEQQCKYVNKLNLNHFQKCYNIAKGDTLTKINTCLLGSLSSYPTGDAFVVDLKTLNVIWDNSVDCKITTKPSLTKDSICNIAYDKNSCLNLAKKLKLGYNGNFIWNFDGSPEIDNWIILPDETHNFDGSVRAVSGLKKQYAVVQGCQLDEIEEQFKLVKYLFNFFISLIMFFELLLFFILSKTKICNSEQHCKYQI